MILITGASGFIGSAIFATLSREYPETKFLLCDWLGSESKWLNVSKHYFDNFIFPENLTEYLKTHSEGLEAVIHMGAVSDTTETDADYILDSNYALTAELWDFCAKHDIRFIYASSAATYGNAASGFDDTNFALKPLNPYGWSKHMCDLRALKHAEQDRARPPQWVGLKFFNVYGPNEYHKGTQTSVAYQLYHQIQRDKKVKLFAAHESLGAPRRDFIYVKDCVKVIKWFLDNEDQSGIFNVGTGEARSFEDMAKACFRALSVAEDIEHIEKPAHLVGKYQYYTEAKMDKLRAIGFDEKFFTLEEGISDYYKNYLLASDHYM